jgi:hypothetical protein
MRGERINVAIPGLSSPTSAKIKFQKSASSDAATSADIDVDKDAKPFPIPNLPLAHYRVTITPKDKSDIDCKDFTVSPAEGSLKLFAFDPTGTEDAEKVKVEGSDALKDTVRLSLRGTGFLLDNPNDNRILLNRRPIDVKWDGCTAPVQTGVPDPGVHGQVIDSYRIDLCYVGVPPGDTLSFEVAQGALLTQAATFHYYRLTELPVALASAGIALSLAILVLVLVRVFKKAQPQSGPPYNVLKILFLDTETNTYSLSKFQFYCWTTAALFGYSYLVISKMLVQRQSWPEIPGGLPAIVGIGAGTSVGSMLITGMRGPKGGGPEEPSLGDLVTTGGAAAPERVQMLVWTILGVAAFCYAVLQHTPGAIKELDPVPSGLMYMMGLSAAGYLSGKLVRKSGPVINEINISPQESDISIAQSSAPPPTGPPNFTQPIAQAQAALKSLTNVPPGSAQNALNALSAGITAVSQVKTLSDAQAAVTQLVGKAGEAEKEAKTAAEAFAANSNNADAGRAAEIAQKATGAVHDLQAAVTSAVSAILPPAARPRPLFARVIELRGRNLSSQATLTIDGVGLPFRMLTPNPDANGDRVPQIAVREAEDPNLAMVLRLTIDPSQLEDPDFNLYKRWFGGPTASTPANIKKLTFSLTNLDGQKSDISFSVL